MNWSTIFLCFILNKICYDDALTVLQEKRPIAQRATPSFFLQQTKIKILAFASGKPVHLQGTDQATNKKSGLQQQSLAIETPSRTKRVTTSGPTL